MSRTPLQRWTLGVAAWVLLAPVAWSQLQQRETQSTPGLTGLPYPTSAVAPFGNVPPDPALREHQLKHLRMQSFKKMRSEAASLMELAAALNAQLQQTASLAEAARADVPAQPAVPGVPASPAGPPLDPQKTAAKIEKLASDIDHRMRGQ